MPVTTSSPVETYVLIESSMDFTIPAQNLTFSHRINGAEVGRLSFQLAGEPLAAIYSNPAPDTSTPLSTILQEAIYNAAISAGLFAGAVTPG